MKQAHFSFQLFFAKYWWVAVCVLIGIAAGIRAYQFGHIPSSPYWEEVALGYDAYSIAQTGRDHHGQVLPIIAFTSFGDYKPVGYFYAVVPFIHLFGLAVWVVRLPSLLAGMALVVGMAVLSWQLFRSRGTVLATVAVITFSPWAIQFSRAAWEVHLGTSFLLWSIITALVVCHHFQVPAARRAKSWPWVAGFSLLLLVGALYTYHAFRLIAPIFAAGFGLMWVSQLGWLRALSHLPQWIKKQRSALTWLVVVFGCFALATAPLVTNLQKPEVKQRFAETNLFADGALIQLSNADRARAGDTILARIQYHRYWYIGRAIVGNLLVHLEPGFLFVQGDRNLRHQVPMMGQLYWLDSMLIGLGIIWLISHRPKVGVALLGWLLLGLFPAALTKATPHALRILPTMPVFLMVIALGIWQLFQWVRVQWRTLLGGMIMLIILGQFAIFWRFYVKVYPVIAATEWQDGYVQMIVEVQKQHSEHPELPIVISREQGRPAMYYWFYTHTDPRRVQAADASAPKDQGEFLRFENVSFVDRIDQVTRPSILAASPNFWPVITATASGTVTIKNAQNTPIWQVGVLP